MRRADRLFRLVQLLRARRITTADALADELEVSPRTVYRDIADLQRSGVPVRGEAGVGYRLEKGFELPPLTFTSDEIEALVIGARMVEAFGDEELADGARQAMTKVEAVLPEPLRRVLRGTALFAPAMPWQAERAASLGPLRSALASGSRVRFAYTRADGAASERTVSPLGLYFWGRTWSLAGWCHLRADYRNFRPDRMRELAVLDEPVDPNVTLTAFIEAMKERGAEDHPALRGAGT